LHTRSVNEISNWQPFADPISYTGNGLKPVKVFVRRFDQSQN